ncbi:MAG: nuclear transport factor 2 family protein [Gammaproteobacteria bacterium]|nr:nuclear transport factor 2 family protein [Gammaproteobacteria bacterium]
MKSKAILSTLLLGISLLLVGNSDAQTSDDSAVWSVIERSWQAEQRGDSKWIDELLSADFVGWEKDSPAPRDKGSTRLWNIFSSKQTDMLEHELYPLSIIVHGDMAVAHYLYSSASRAKGEKVRTEQGRYTDILVRSDGQWKFIAWHGGADHE